MVSAAFQTRIQAALDASAAFRAAADSLDAASRTAPSGFAGWFGKRSTHFHTQMSEAVSQIENGLRELRASGIRDTDRGIRLAERCAKHIEAARLDARGPEFGMRRVRVPLTDEPVVTSLRVASKQVKMAPLGDPPHGTTIAERKEAAALIGVDITEWAKALPPVHIDLEEFTATTIDEVVKVAPDLAPLADKVAQEYLNLKTYRGIRPRHETAGQFEADLNLLQMHLRERGIQSPVHDLSAREFTISPSMERA